MGHVAPDPENANRWVAREHIDDSTCDPCRDNNGKLYKNRAAAYEDYPGGTGFINCVGAEHGNACRGKVVKRRGGSNVTPDLMSLVNRARAHEKKFCSAREFTNAEGPTQGLRVAAPVAVVAAAGGTAAPAATKVYVYDYIGGYDGIDAMDVVTALAGVTGDVDVHINSGGGSIFEGTAIYHAFRNYTGGTVRVYVDGIAASAASLIAMAGTEIIIEPASTMMVHAGSGGCWGTAKDMRELADVLDLLSKSIAGVYASRAGGTAEAWFELMDGGDTWYNAEQAVEAKLADRIGGAQIDPDESPDEPSVPEGNAGDLFALIGATARPARPTTTPPAPAAGEPAAFDLAGIRDALKGILA